MAVPEALKFRMEEELKGLCLWFEFIEILEQGGVKAVMAIVDKKAKDIPNLPDNANSVLGIAFEEIQIGKMMAEIVRRGSRIELIAGDGSGTFQYKGVKMSTPEYVDAVLHDLRTDRYFSIQFKYSDNPRNLVSMIKKWNKKWGNRISDPNMPDALHHKNVVLIGPNDTVSDIINLHGDEIDIQQLEQNEQVQFTPDTVDVVQAFLYDNTDLLKEIVNSAEYVIHEELKRHLKKNKESLNSLENNLKKHQKEVKELENKLGKFKNSDGIDEGIAFHKANISEKEEEISLVKRKWTEYKEKLKDQRRKLKTVISDKINSTYREEYVHSVWKEVDLDLINKTRGGIILFSLLTVPVTMTLSELIFKPTGACKSHKH